MKDYSPSITALATARMRTIHTLSDPLPIINDLWGSRLAPASALASAMFPADSNLTDESGVEEFVDSLLRASPAYANVIARTCYTEDALNAALSEGVNQYVLIGAGYDSYALRRPADAQELEVFEVDHPATQAMKKQRLSELGVAVDDKNHFIASDLGQETIGSALSGSNYKSREPAFLSWLGVTMYLTREANMATLGSVAQCCASGSLLVFSYVDQEVFESGYSENVEAVTELKRNVEAMGEPLVSGFYPDALENELRHLGFELEEDVEDMQILERYDPNGVNGLKSSRISRIARARVMGK